MLRENSAEQKLLSGFIAEQKLLQVLNSDLRGAGLECRKTKSELCRHTLELRETISELKQPFWSSAETPKTPCGHNWAPQHFWNPAEKCELRGNTLEFLKTTSDQRGNTLKLQEHNWMLRAVPAELHWVIWELYVANL